jgi:hypothetical protein
MADTPNLSIPVMTSAQSQKHVTFNEAMLRLELTNQVSVIDMTTTAPPASPTDGDSYIIDATATGDWVGRENDIAMWLNGQWNYATPKEGWLIYNQDTTNHQKFNGTAWVLAF